MRSLKAKEVEVIRRRIECSYCKKDFWVRESDLIFFDYPSDPSCKKRNGKSLKCPFCGKE